MLVGQNSLTWKKQTLAKVYYNQARQQIFFPELIILFCFSETRLTWPEINGTD